MQPSNSSKDMGNMKQIRIEGTSEKTTLILASNKYISSYYKNVITF